MQQAQFIFEKIQTHRSYFHFSIQNNIVKIYILYNSITSQYFSILVYFPCKIRHQQRFKTFASSQHSTASSSSHLLTAFSWHYLQQFSVTQNTSSAYITIFIVTIICWTVNYFTVFNKREILSLSYIRINCKDNYSRRIRLQTYHY